MLNFGFHLTETATEDSVIISYPEVGSLQNLVERGVGGRDSL